MRVRITYQKNGALLYTSTLDVQTIWERSVRRAGLILQYSQGFHPQPRIQIANPLPLGFAGAQEIIDIWLADERKPEEIKDLLNKSVPEGIYITEVNTIEENGPSLPKQIDASTYSIELLNPDDSIDKIQASSEIMLSKDSLPRVRNRKSYDLRPLIQEMSVQTNQDGKIVILLKMPSNSNQTGRPEEVMAELGIPLENFRITRTSLVFSEKYA